MDLTHCVVRRRGGTCLRTSQSSLKQTKCQTQKGVLVDSCDSRWRCLTACELGMSPPPPNRKTRIMKDILSLSLLLWLRLTTCTRETQLSLGSQTFKELWNNLQFDCFQLFRFDFHHSPTKDDKRTSDKTDMRGPTIKDWKRMTL